jgi:hypothetical protein
LLFSLLSAKGIDEIKIVRPVKPLKQKTGVLCRFRYWLHDDLPLCQGQATTYSHRFSASGTIVPYFSYQICKEYWMSFARRPVDALAASGRFLLETLPG